VKGGVLEGQILAAEDVRRLARLPSRDMLIAQFAGVVASPLTGLVRGLGSMIAGLAIALAQVRDKKEAESPSAAEPEPEPQPTAEAPAEEAPAEEAPAAESDDEQQAEQSEAEQEAQ
jgi:large subunit ribosomal protein L10